MIVGEVLFVLRNWHVVAADVINQGKIQRRAVPALLESASSRARIITLVTFELRRCALAMADLPFLIFS